MADKDKLFSRGLVAQNLNYLTPNYPKNGEYSVKIRKNSNEIDAQIEFSDTNDFSVLFDKPQLSVTPGQSVVIYKKDQLIGGGIIKQALGVANDPY